jgi:hypothetical protein
LPEAIQQANLKPPALFVVGPTAALAESLDWFASRPLLGRRVLMVHPEPAFAESLDLGGAELVVVPIPITPAAQLVMRALPLTDCILLHAHDVEVMEEERAGPGWGPDVVAWCLTARAAERAHQLGWQRVQRLDPHMSAPELIRAMTRRTNRD